MSLNPNILHENWIKNQETTIVGAPIAGAPDSPAPSAGFQTTPPQSPSLDFPVSRIINNCQFFQTNFINGLTLAANPKRIYFLIQNQGAVALYINFDGTPPPFATGLNIPVGGVYEPFAPPTNQITFSGSGYVIEGRLLS